MNSWLQAKIFCLCSSASKMQCTDCKAIRSYANIELPTCSIARVIRNVTETTDF